MMISAEKLKELLVGPGFILENDFKKYAEEAVQKHAGLGDLLIENNLIKDEQLGRLMAEYLKEPFADLKQEKIDKQAIKSIPESVARFKGVLIFSKDGDTAKIGMTDPTDLEMRHILEKRFGNQAKFYLITRRDHENALSNYQGSLEESFSAIWQELSRQDISPEVRDEGTVKVVDMLLSAGHAINASDIHIEPYEAKVMVRFRIDGVMHDVLEAPRQLLELIIARIKIMAKLRTDEHFAPQDGKIRFADGKENLDIRVSVMPTAWGEKTVMRLLSPRSRQYDLADLGLSKENLEKIQAAVRNPHGMILVTGPTGSGKTTTVYGVMKILNTRDVNITTIEDPIEYYIEGVSQTQVNKKTDLTFARGLRAIVRQDPDIIMVGEIRDEETAGIAVNSALTGHLVLSTLHTNDAATTLPRLLDMGIEPFLVASTVNVAIGQRLVRQICLKCRVSVKLEEDEIKILELLPNVKKILAEMGHNELKDLQLYKGAGCPVCAHTGFQGRVGIFEIMEMNQELKELVVNRASSDKIMEAARRNGMTTMLYDGIKKAFSGTTTIMEVARVTKE